jgi:hypothetical protein
MHLAARFVPVAAARVRASKCNGPGATSAAHPLPLPPSLKTRQSQGKTVGFGPHTTDLLRIWFVR